MVQKLTEREMEVFLESDSEVEINSSESRESDAEDEGPSACARISEWTRHHHRCQTGTRVLPFLGDPSGFRREEAPRVQRDSSLWTIFLLFFTEVIHLLVEEINRLEFWRISTMLSASSVRYYSFLLVSSAALLQKLRSAPIVVLILIEEYAKILP